MKLAHVFFGALPVGTGFWHKDGWHIKTDEEEAYSVVGRRWIFEVHWGVVITKNLAVVLNIPADSYRREQPPEDDAYIEKLFGVPVEPV